MELPVLYDGWSLAYQPNSPAALHLLALLAYLPSEVRPQVALPAAPHPALKLYAPTLAYSTPDTPRARLAWEQRLLPRLVGETGAKILHLFSATPPWTGRFRTVISPAGYGEFLGSPAPFGEEELAERDRPGGFFERVRDAVSRGSMSLQPALFWPEDLPPPAGRAVQAEPGGRGSLLTLPPVLHPTFTSGASTAGEGGNRLDLPESYILYHGPHSPGALRRLLDAWSWAAGPVGEYYPLLVPGLDEKSRARLEALCSEYGLGRTVRTLPPVSLPDLAALFAGCSALFHPSPLPPWGDSLRPALAAGRPVVAAETLLSDALVGPAAYLIPPSDPRGLGAALITTIVEESVAERLSRAGRQRAASWDTASFGQRLLKAYRDLSD